MSDVTVGTHTLPFAHAADCRPSPAKGILWGTALSIPLWAVITWVVSRAL